MFEHILGEYMNKCHKHNGIMISAPQSGSGKTIITCALLRAFKKKGVNICAFKCGPDYIDPMFHKRCIGVPSENLDAYFIDKSELVNTYDEIMDIHNSEFAIVEGAMGLFDGLGGISEEASAYGVAGSIGLPIVLVIDVRGMGRSVIPLISGFMSYDKDKLIRGVILNKITEGFYNQIKPVIEEELHIRVYGYFANQEQTLLVSRHLGLVMPDEISDIEYKLDLAADNISKTVDMDALLEIYSDLHFADAHATRDEAITVDREKKKKYLDISDNCDDSPVIAVARDEAFCFYYEENLRWLRRAGARLVYFSPLSDSRLPDGASGILLGGGYPELYADKLSQNISIRSDILDRIKSGMPTVAECGGFMYLHNSMETKEHNKYEMVGAIDAEVSYTGHLVRFGYIELSDIDKHWICEGSIKGHEFHYYDSTDNGAGCCIKKPVSNRSWKGIHTDENMFVGFPHLYYGSCPEFAYNFVKKCSDYHKNGKVII